jgi:hypothetical protein
MAEGSVLVNLAIFTNDRGFFIFNPILKRFHVLVAVLGVDKVEGGQPYAIFRRYPKDGMRHVVYELEPPVLVDDGLELPHSNGFSLRAIKYFPCLGLAAFLRHPGYHFAASHGLTPEPTSFLWSACLTADQLSWDHDEGKEIAATSIYPLGSPGGHCEIRFRPGL